MIGALERRLRQYRARALVRAWNYRQNDHARGVWFRLRRTLVDAREAFVVAREEAEALVAEGHEPAPVGAELEPRKVILVIPAARVARLSSARPLAVRLSAELLAAECLVLVPFDRGPVS